VKKQLKLNSPLRMLIEMATFSWQTMRQVTTMLKPSLSSKPLPRPMLLLLRLQALCLLEPSLRSPRIRTTIRRHHRMWLMHLSFLLINHRTVLMAPLAEGFVHDINLQLHHRLIQMVPRKVRTVAAMTESWISTTTSQLVTEPLRQSGRAHSEGLRRGNMNGQMDSSQTETCGQQVVTT